MSNLFDDKRWYHFYFDEKEEYAMVGTSLTDQKNKAGAVFFTGANLTSPTQKWQITRLSSGYYVLRTADSGGSGYLAAHWTLDEEEPGSTQVRMVKDEIADDSVYWKIDPWEDETFYFYNKANGTKWHLGAGGKTGTVAQMQSNITKPQNGQRFSFKPLAVIGNDEFSKVNLPSATQKTPASTPTSTPTSTPPSNQQNSSGSISQSSGGLSAGAKAAIGGSIGGVALIALVILGLFFFRRRKQQQVSPPPYAEPYQDNVEAGGAVKYAQVGIADKPELDATSVTHEMSAEPIPPAELPERSTTLPVEAR